MYDDARIDRRELLRLGAVGGLGLAGFGVAACGSDSGASARSGAITLKDDAPGRLVIVEWPGFEVDDLWKPYARQFPGQKPRFALDPDQFPKVANGYVADLAHPPISDLPRWVAADLIEPFDTSLLKNFKDLHPAFVERCNVDGKQYAIPSDWGFNSVLYRADKVEPAEESWGLLFDDRYKGHIAWRDAAKTMLSAAGLYLQVGDPYDMSDDELDEATALLREKKPLVRQLWTSETDLRADMAQGNIWIAPGEAGTVVEMQRRGFDVVFLDPKEGRISWLEGFARLKTCKRPYHAHAYVDAWTSPSSGLWLSDKYSYGSTNSKVDLTKLSERLVKAFKLDDPESVNKDVVPAGYVKRNELYLKAWSDVKAS
jgi:spermidine/putrescine-binding protein